MNPSTATARLLVDELVAGGVTDAVLCPGSRNAPLSYALWAADRERRLRLHVRIDERSAAFLALGLARAGGRPVPVVCTSGTAAANFHPAVLEASHGGIPLVAVTADRPAALVGTGANQTIVQPGLYGPAPRWAGGVVASAAADDAREALRAALAAARGRHPAGPGPAHLNVAFAEPLVPDAEPGRAGPAVPAAPLAGSSGAVPAFGALPAFGAVPGSDAVPGSGALPGSDGSPPGDPPPSGDPTAWDPGAPTVVIAGSTPVGVAAPALPPGVPVVAEPSSPLWPTASRTGPWLLGAGLDLAPRQVVLHGRPTLHRAVSRLLADPEVVVHAVAGTNIAGWPTTVRALGAVPPLAPPRGWVDAWAAADAAASAALERGLRTAPTGLRTAAALLTALPAGAVLTLGSSNPVRDVALAARPRTGVTVYAHRGVAGIDGTVSSAIGAALAHQARGGGPGFALLGDLTLLHDTTGLVIGPDEPVPDLTVVVLNDGGGGIFSLLEQGAPEHAASFERIFGTPHRVRLDHLCAGLGLPYRRLTDPDSLPDALGPGTGIRVIEVAADRAELRSGHAALRATVLAALR